MKNWSVLTVTGGNGFQQFIRITHIHKQVERGSTVVPKTMKYPNVWKRSTNSVNEFSEVASYAYKKNQDKIDSSVAYKQ